MTRMQKLIDNTDHNTTLYTTRKHIEDILIVEDPKFSEAKIEVKYQGAMLQIARDNYSEANDKRFSHIGKKCAGDVEIFESLGMDPKEAPADEKLEKINKTLSIAKADMDKVVKDRLPYLEYIKGKIEPVFDKIKDLHNKAKVEYLRKRGDNDAADRMESRPYMPLIPDAFESTDKLVERLRTNRCRSRKMLKVKIVRVYLRRIGSRFPERAVADIVKKYGNIFKEGVKDGNV